MEWTVVEQLWAVLGSGDGVVAVVAHGFVPIAVESQRQVAIWAGEDEATGWTLNTGRVTATVEQQDDLSVFLVQDTVHGLHGGFRQATLVDIDAVDAEVSGTDFCGGSS